MDYSMVLSEEYLLKKYFKSHLVLPFDDCYFGSLLSRTNKTKSLKTSKMFYLGVTSYANEPKLRKAMLRFGSLYEQIFCVANYHLKF